MRINDALRGAIDMRTSYGEPTDSLQVTARTSFGDITVRRAHPVG